MLRSLTYLICLSHYPLPGVKRVGADVMLAAHIRCLDAAFLLLEDADDLLLAEPSFHAFLLLKLQRIHALFWHTFRGLRQFLFRKREIFGRVSKVMLMERESSGRHFRVCED